MYTMWCYMRSGERAKKIYYKPLLSWYICIQKNIFSQGQATSFKVMFDLKEKKRFEVKSQQQRVSRLSLNAK